MRSLTFVRSCLRQGTLSAALYGLLVVWLAAPAPVWADTEKFALSKAATIKEVELKPGQYMLKIEDNDQVTVYQGKDKVGEFEAEVKPLEKAQPVVAVTSRGDKVLEIRGKKHLVIFDR